MKRIACALLMVLMLSTLITANAEDFDSQVDGIFKQYKTVGASMVVMHHGQVVYERQYGLANKYNKQPVTSETHFRIASITKMVSAIGIMRLVESGRVDLDQDISKYFGYEIVNPYYPETPITLRQCMSHTTSLSESGGYSILSRKVHDMLSKEMNRKTNFKKAAPGSTYSYSNFGAGLMGSVIESVTGKSINTYMTESVFAPLGIDAAYSATLLKDTSDIASIYENGKITKSASLYLKEEYNDKPDPEKNYRTTVGDIFMKAKDLATIADALCRDGSHSGTRLLKEESLELMRMNQKDVNASVTGDSPYGLNTARVDSIIEGVTLYGHQGMASGAMCNVYFDPDTEFVFVLLTNGCSLERDDRIGRLPKRMVNFLYPIFTK